MVDGPGGEHVWDTPVSALTSGIMKANLSGQCLYALSAIFTKCTLLVLYLRIFRPALQSVNQIWIGIGFIVISHIAMAIAQIAILVPRPGETWFNSTGKEDQDAATTIVAAQGVFSSVTDIFVLCIPISLVIGLHMPFHKKAGVCAIFMTGLM